MAAAEGPTAAAALDAAAVGVVRRDRDVADAVAAAVEIRYSMLRPGTLGGSCCKTDAAPPTEAVAPDRMKAAAVVVADDGVTETTATAASPPAAAETEVEEEGRAVAVEPKEMRPRGYLWRTNL